jgi:hypothetical protein
MGSHVKYPKNWQSALAAEPTSVVAHINALRALFSSTVKFRIVRPLCCNPTGICGGREDVLQP